MLSDSYRNSLGYDCAFYLIKEKNNSKILLIYNYGSVLSTLFHKFIYFIEYFF